jgi:hypothetical protein
MRTTKVLRIGLFVAAGLLLVAGSVYGDVLELKNGTILNGRYVGGTTDTIRFEISEGMSVVETSQAIALTFTTLAPVAPTSAAPQEVGSVPQAGQGGNSSSRYDAAGTHDGWHFFP